MKIIKRPVDIFDKYSIRTKMLVIYVIVIIPVFIGSMFILSRIRNILSESEKKEILNNADTLRTHMTDMVQITENVAFMISDNTAIRNYISQDYENKIDAYRDLGDREILKYYMDAFPQLCYIRIFIDKKNFAYNSEFKPVTERVREQGWYIDALSNKGSGSWRVVRDVYDNQLYLGFAVPLIDKHENVEAVLMLEVSPNWIEDFLEERSVYRTVLSVNNGVVFYSTADSVETGSVISDVNTNLKLPWQRDVVEANFVGVDGITVMETFMYGKTDSVFQIFLINPGGKVNAETDSLTSYYTAYVISLFVVSLIIVILFTSVFASRIQKLRDRMHEVAMGDFENSLIINGNDEIAELNSDLTLMVDSMRLLMKENYDARIQAEQFKLSQVEAEFKALASQINPHFLYNTLETIRMKAYCNNDKETAGLIKQLGKFMRRVLGVKSTSVTLKSELEFTESYFKLQKARFGERISYEIESDVDDDYPVLPLIIQPIAENAFVHGVESSKENAKIVIRVYYCGECVFIDIIDNGRGMSADDFYRVQEKLRNNDTSSGKSIGVTNVNKRIKMYHGDEYGINIRSREGVGTQVRIILPKNVKKNETIEMTGNVGSEGKDK